EPEAPIRVLTNGRKRRGGEVPVRRAVRTRREQRDGVGLASALVRNCAFRDGVTRRSFGQVTPQLLGPEAHSYSPCGAYAEAASRSVNRLLHLPANGIPRRIASTICPCPRPRHPRHGTGHPCRTVCPNMVRMSDNITTPSAFFTLRSNSSA